MVKEPNRWQPLSQPIMAWFMMTSSNRSIFRVTGILCRKYTDHQWNPRTRASDAELWCFLWSAPWRSGWVNNDETGDWDAIVPIMTTLQCFFLTHVCIIQPWCVDSPQYHIYTLLIWIIVGSDDMMACCLFGIRPSTEPVMTSHQSDSEKNFQIKCDQD